MPGLRAAREQGAAPLALTSLGVRAPVPDLHRRAVAPILRACRGGGVRGMAEGWSFVANCDF